jgi:hypothetical protein
MSFLVILLCLISRLYNSNREEAGISLELLQRSSIILKSLSAYYTSFS